MVLKWRDVTDCSKCVKTGNANGGQPSWRCTILISPSQSICFRCFKLVNPHQQRCVTSYLHMRCTSRELTCTRLDRVRNDSADNDRICRSSHLICIDKCHASRTGCSPLLQRTHTHTHTHTHTDTKVQTLCKRSLIFFYQEKTTVNQKLTKSITKYKWLGSAPHCGRSSSTNQIVAP